MLESRKKIEIPLRTVAGADKTLSSNIRSTVEHEYAVKYLERIGVHASKDRVDYMLSNMPVERALVVPVWTRSSLILVPERKEEKDQNVIKQIYTGSKEIEVSKRKLTSFYGKGVSEPGSRPKRPLSQSDKKQKGRSRRRDLPYVELNFPSPSRLPFIEINSTAFKQLIKPLAVNDGRLKMAIKSFCASLSEFVPRIFDDKSGRLNVIIQKFLGCLMCRRLFGLLCHYVFWNIVHPFARRALVASKSQHAELHTDVNRASTPDNASSFARRKSMMNFSSPDLKKVIDFSTLPIMAENRVSAIVRGSLVKSRAQGIINANRAATVLGLNATSPTLPPGNDSTSTADGGSVADATLSSDTSLSSEEKEMLYLQLEECLNKLHVQMGFSRQALVNSRQALVAGCHFIVNDILCAHYAWLGGKREPTQDTLYSAPSTRSSTRSTKCEPTLTDADLSNISYIRQEVLKHVNETLTELLDPARVYCDKISREMFQGDERGKLLNEVDPAHIVDGELPRTAHHRSSCDSKRENKYFATSVAVRAIFSDADNHETKKFLRMNSPGPMPLVNGKKGQTGITAEPSTTTIGSPLTASIVSPQRDLGADDRISRPGTAESAYTTVSTTFATPRIHSQESNSIDIDDCSNTMRDFKTLFSADMKVHPKSSSPSFSHRHSQLYRRSEKLENDMNPSPSTARQFTRQESREFLATRRLRGVSTSKVGMTKDDNNVSDMPDGPLSITAKSKLMGLIVERSKAKYSNNHILQFARTPNARYREQLLTTGGNKKKTTTKEFKSSSKH